MWGDIMDPEKATQAGQSAHISLQVLCQAKRILPNDDLLYERGFGKVSINVKQFVTIKKIDPTGIPTAAWTCDLTGEKASKEFHSLNMLEHLILDVDGRVEKEFRPNGNAWKSIKVFRKNRLLGRMWTIRKEHYEATTI